MALAIKKPGALKPPVVVPKLVPKVVPASAPIVAPEPKAKGETKTVTVRMQSSHLDMLEEIQSIAECDRSEAIKRAVRLLHTALSGHDAHLIVSDAAGAKQTVPLMNKGVPR